jgi:hypothetical protein
MQVLDIIEPIAGPYFPVIIESRNFAKNDGVRECQW